MLPPYLHSEADFQQFLHRVHTGQLPKAEWNHAAHLTASAAEIASGPAATAMDRVRNLILTYNAAQGIVSTPDSGYHETITRFWVDRIVELLPALGRGATPFDAARATVAAFAHRRNIFDAYYGFDVLKSREARASYIPPGLASCYSPGMSQPHTWAILPLDADRDPLEVLSILNDKGIAAELVLRVPHDQADAAHELLTAPTDNTHDLDLETIMRVPDIEAASVRGLLESNGIEVVTEQAVGLPNFPTEINVPKKDAALARQLIEDAQKAASEEPIS